VVPVPTQVFLPYQRLHVYRGIRYCKIVTCDRADESISIAVKQINEWKDKQISRGAIEQLSRWTF
jgi:hypothetical protein